MTDKLERWMLALLYYALMLIIFLAHRQDIIYEIRSGETWLMGIAIVGLLVVIPLIVRYLIRKETILDKIHKI